jgi:hypothetical protein
VRLEDGVLTVRYPDDPDEVFSMPRLGDQVRGRAKDLCATLRSENGVYDWVTPVVVLWADFPARRVEHDGVVYVHGDELVGWLRSLLRPGIARPERTDAHRLRRESDSQIELVISVDIARRLGISPQRVHVLVSGAGFPKPLGKLGRSAVWRWSMVARWARETGRLPAL